MKQLTEFIGPVFKIATEHAARVIPGITEHPAGRQKAAVPKKAENAEAEAHAATSHSEQVSEPVLTDEPAVEAPAVPQASSAAVDLTQLSPEQRTEVEQAIQAATGVKEERLQRLTDAVLLYGHQASRVRLLRIFKADECPKDAKKSGEFAYLIDQQVALAKAPAHDDKGGRRGGPGKPGAKNRSAPRAPGEVGPPLDATSLQGRFSMDAVKEDRRRKMAGRGERTNAGPGGGSRGRRPAGK